MDIVNEDMEVVGVREEDAEEKGKMEATDSLWQPLKRKARRKKRENKITI